MIKASITLLPKFKNTVLKNLNMLKSSQKLVTEYSVIPKRNFDKYYTCIIEKHQIWERTFNNVMSGAVKLTLLSYMGYVFVTGKPVLQPLPQDGFGKIVVEPNDQGPMQPRKEIKIYADGMNDSKVENNEDNKITFQIDGQEVDALKILTKLLVEAQKDEQLDIDKKKEETAADLKGKKSTDPAGPENVAEPKKKID